MDGVVSSDQTSRQDMDTLSDDHWIVTRRASNRLVLSHCRNRDITHATLARDEY